MRGGQSRRRVCLTRVLGACLLPPDAYEAVAKSWEGLNSETSRFLDRMVVDGQPLDAILDGLEEAVKREVLPLDYVSALPAFNGRLARREADKVSYARVVHGRVNLDALAAALNKLPLALLEPIAKIEGSNVTDFFRTVGDAVLINQLLANESQLSENAISDAADFTRRVAAHLNLDADSTDQLLKLPYTVRMRILEPATFNDPEFVTQTLPRAVKFAARWREELKNGLTPNDRWCLDVMRSDLLPQRVKEVHQQLGVDLASATAADLFELTLRNSNTQFLAMVCQRVYKTDVVQLGAGCEYVAARERALEEAKNQVRMTAVCGLEGFQSLLHKSRPVDLPLKAVDKSPNRARLIVEQWLTGHYLNALHHKFLSVTSALREPNGIVDESSSRPQMIIHQDETERLTHGYRNLFSVACALRHDDPARQPNSQWSDRAEALGLREKCFCSSLVQMFYAIQACLYPYDEVDPEPLITGLNHLHRVNPFILKGMLLFIDEMTSASKRRAPRPAAGSSKSWDIITEHALNKLRYCAINGRENDINAPMRLAL